MFGELICRVIALLINVHIVDPLEVSIDPINILVKWKQKYIGRELTELHIVKNKFGVVKYLNARNPKVESNC